MKTTLVLVNASNIRRNTTNNGLNCLCYQNDMMELHCRDVIIVWSWQLSITSATYSMVNRMHLTLDRILAQAMARNAAYILWCSAF